MSEVIPDAAVEAAANAISEASGMRFDGFWSRVEDLEPEDRDYALLEARAALESAAPHMLAEIWQAAYKQGVADERASAMNIGIAACLCSSEECHCKVEPARLNPYGAA